MVLLIEKEGVESITKTYGYCTCFLKESHSYGKIPSESLFKFSYFFLPIVFPKALCYIVVLMATAIDFWIVKNIVGRKLVKMRWWYIIDSEGNERWYYESRGNNRINGLTL